MQKITLFLHVCVISGSQKFFDEKLKAVAQRVVKHEEMNDLGKDLGFEPEDIQRYAGTNMNMYMGTLLMLRDWRKKQPKATECGALKDVLEKAGQNNIADELFGTPLMKMICLIVEDYIAPNVLLSICMYNIYQHSQ